MNPDTGKSRLLLALAVTLALTTLMTLLYAGSASAATPTKTTILTEAGARKALLTIPQLNTATKLKNPSTSPGAVCHTSPYLSGQVHYCYYEYLHSDTAHTTRAPWVNHVDVLAFPDKATALAYIKEMTDSHKASVKIKQTKSTGIWYDTAAPIFIPGTPDPIQVNGPTVSVFMAKGANVVYTACADPAAKSSSALVQCATRVANVQYRKLP